MSGIGHNRGPTMERGRGWRRYAWSRARAELLPKMPIEVVRRRVQRARELGLDYKSYAGIRAATGRDVIALLFSDNALRLAKTSEIEARRRATLSELSDVRCLIMVHPPHLPDHVLGVNAVLDKADYAPGFLAEWSTVRDRVARVKGQMPADGIVVIGETWLEREWCDAGRLAGYIPADRYFAR